MKIALIGAGRLAWNLGHALLQAGHQVVGVWSRTEASARALGEQLSAAWTTDLGRIPAAVEVVVLAVADQAVAEVARALAPRKEVLYLHTAGSLPLQILDERFQRCGVLYPMQTFSKERFVNFSQVSCFVEGNSEKSLQAVRDFATSLGSEVLVLDSAQRRYLHLAAVFACNFTNHCYSLAYDILEQQGIPPHVLRTLTDETAQKIHQMDPREAQTGPAVRGDAAVIAAHQALLAQEPEKAALYRMMSESIQHFTNTRHD